MLYRKYGKTNEEISVLGFGCMRFPVIDDDTTKINEEEAIKMLRYAIDSGVNYIDTAYPYHGGESEPFVGRALRDGYRERVKLATKLSPWMVETREDMDRILNDQLNRLETNTIDFYLLHALNDRAWTKFKSLDVIDFLEKAKASGKIKHIGFSFHDRVDLFKEIVDYYDWSFCQIQYNYLDENTQAGREGLEYAASKGLGIAIMEPLRGGSLTRKLPHEIERAWEQSPIKRSPAEWALRWLWNHPEISVVLSGMTTMEQVEENIKVADQAEPDSLTEKEMALIDFAKQTFKEKMKVNCTACKYCMPCPVGVDIPQCFALYNEAHFTEDIPRAKFLYNGFILTRDEEKASNCIECGKCEKQCPQDIAIRKELKNVALTLEDN